MCHLLLFRIHSSSFQECWLLVAQNGVSSLELPQGDTLCQFTLAESSQPRVTISFGSSKTLLVGQGNNFDDVYEFQSSLLNHLKLNCSPLSQSCFSFSLTDVNKSTSQLTVCEFVSQSFPGNLAQIIKIHFCLYQNVSNLLFMKLQTSLNYFLQLCLCIYVYVHVCIFDLFCSSDCKESACNAGDPGSTHGLERISGERNSNLLQYSCLKNPWTEDPFGPQSMGLKRIRHN